MTPLIFLLLVLALPLAGLVAQRLSACECRAIERLARENNLHFACDDRFKIAPKVAELLPSAGAASVRVYDVMYGKDGAVYHFVFSIEWTEGVVRWKRRVRRVASFSEEKRVSSAAVTMRLSIAEGGSPRIEQYKKLYANCCGKMRA